jgi:ADP-ribose/NAD+ diphosphatase
LIDQLSRDRNRKIEKSKIDGKKKKNRSANSFVLQSAMSAFEYKSDLYNGATIDGELPECPLEFAERLGATVTQLLASHRRGVWLRIASSHSQLIPVALKQFDFEFHHARKDYCMLTRWLPADSVSALPDYTNAYVGVGGLAVNSRNEVLAVQEKSGPAAGRGLWKLPGGMMEGNEMLVDTARREVLEETGIRTLVDGLLCFQQSAVYQFGRTGFYCVVKLRLDGDDQTIAIQESEIAACQWMPADEFVAQPVYSAGLFGAITHLCGLVANGEPKFVMRQASLPHLYKPGNALLYASQPSIEAVKHYADASKVEEAEAKESNSAADAASSSNSRL